MYDHYNVSYYFLEKAKITLLVFTFQKSSSYVTVMSGLHYNQDIFVFL